MEEMDSQRRFVMSEYDVEQKKLEVFLHHHHFHGTMRKHFTDIIEHYCNIEHLRIICTNRKEELEDLEEDCGMDDVSESSFLHNLEPLIISTLRNLRSLRVETFSSSPTVYFNWKYLSKHPCLERVTVSNRIQRNVRDKIDIYKKFALGARTVEFCGVGLHKEMWAAVMELRMRFFKNIVELEAKSDYPVECHGVSQLYSLQCLNIPGFTITETDFFDLCNNCTKLEKLVVHINDRMTLGRFSNVRKLKNLKTLVVMMNYHFTRQQLIEVLHFSDFNQLNVTVLEFVAKGGPEEKELSSKNGLVNVSFSKSSRYLNVWRTFWKRFCTFTSC